MPGAWLGMKSIRSQVNSYLSIRSHFGQLVLIFRSVRTHEFFSSVNSYSFGQLVLIFGQFALILVNSFSH